MNARLKQSKATLAGFTAILMWAVLALFTDMAGDVPPFQIAAMSFFIGTLVGIIWNITRRIEAPEPRIPIKIALIGGIGLFAYHALYFAALKNAPAIEASLIAYLWPLLIVVGSALLPGEKLGLHHILGTLMGFLGTFLIISDGNGFSLNADYSWGYALAFVAAFTWAGYSLLSRTFAGTPTKSVIYYCAISTVLSVIAHGFFETTIMPSDLSQWLAIIGLGLLPVGAAFYVWDHGMKHGNIQIIGASSYASPLLSTIILILFARSTFTWNIAIACLLITAGAAIAAKNLILKKNH